MGSLTGVKVSDGSAFKLSELGGFASGANGDLTISLSENRFSSGGISLTTGRTVSAVLTNRVDEASNIQIFTREGRHVAGSTPTDSKIAYWQSQMDESGAFNKGAVYNADYRNESGAAGYMDMEIKRSDSQSEVLIKTDFTISNSTITFDFLEGIDTDEGSPDGKFASASQVSYSATIGDLTATVDRDDVAGTSGADVAIAMATELRKNAPTVYIEGLVSLRTPYSFNLGDVGLTESAINSAGKITVGYQEAIYTFTSDGSNITVNGGPDNAVDLSYSSSGNLVSGKMETRPVDGDAVYHCQASSIYLDACIPISWASESPATVVKCNVTVAANIKV